MSVCLSVSDFRPHRCTELDQISYGVSLQHGFTLDGLRFFSSCTGRAGGRKTKCARRLAMDCVCIDCMYGLRPYLQCSSPVPNDVITVFSARPSFAR